MKISREELEDRIWFRAMKVTYTTAYVVAILLVVGALIVSVASIFAGETGMWGVIVALIVIGAIIVPFVFKLIAKAFFYIVTGQWEK